MRRREFIILLGGAAAAWPIVARTQQAAMPVIGFINGGTQGGYALRAVPAFRQGLMETGYIADQNVKIEYHWAEGQYERLPKILADVVRRQVTVIAATTTPAALAAKTATATIPIIFETAGDPIALGLVDSLNRPGRNITGVTQQNSELVSKRLGLLHDLLPTAKIVGFLVNTNDPRTEDQSKDMQQAANALGLQIHVLKLSSDAEIETAFVRLAQVSAGAVIIGTGEFFNGRPGEIAALAARHRMPAFYQLRQFAAAGGLISYGASITEAYRLAGNYTGRVLKGEKPSDLPVLRPTKFELIINLKTADALGLTIPPGVLAIADEVIE
jgi:putative ABC transport system substrate-binding protein